MELIFEGTLSHGNIGSQPMLKQNRDGTLDMLSISGGVIVDFKADGNRGDYSNLTWVQSEPPYLGTVISQGTKSLTRQGSIGFATDRRKGSKLYRT